jgi:hypothetical protein
MNNGDKPAHPANQGWHTDGGLTKREHFTAMAMQGLLASGIVKDEEDFGSVPKAARMMADALLKELDK